MWHWAKLPHVDGKGLSEERPMTSSGRAWVRESPKLLDATFICEHDEPLPFPDVKAEAHGE
jgi:hypothetical protein